MTLDIETLSAKELGALISKASQRKKKLDKRKPAAGVRRQINAIAKKAGYTIGELFGHGASQKAEKAAARAPRRKGTKAGSKIEPKYRNPDNHNQTWAARGKQPKWLAAEIAKGRTLAEFAIAK
ncbi:MAG: H-NS histone family protein [Proteobacteria bacterium]|nr:H-NS histone family protein [Pseudomonadota bacterium]